MILTGSKIASSVKNGDIIIEPFSSKNVTTNSYDFHLGNQITEYVNHVLDPKKNNKTRDITLGENGLRLEPNKLYLGNTLEIIGSNKYVPIIRGKSSTGRIGLFIHITADLIDIGSINQYTLMLHATQPVYIYPGMPIGQVTFWSVKGDINVLYNGKYQGLNGPQPSQIHKDFN